MFRCSNYSDKPFTINKIINNMDKKFLNYIKKGQKYINIIETSVLEIMLNCIYGLHERRLSNFISFKDFFFKC